MKAHVKWLTAVAVLRFARTIEWTAARLPSRRRGLRRWLPLS